MRKPDTQKSRASVNKKKQSLKNINAIDWERRSASFLTDKGLRYRLIKKSYKSKIIVVRQLKMYKRLETLNRTENPDIKKNMKRCLTSLVIREMQIK